MYHILSDDHKSSVIFEPTGKRKFRTGIRGLSYKNIETAFAVADKLMEDEKREKRLPKRGKRKTTNKPQSSAA